MSAATPPRAVTPDSLYRNDRIHRAIAHPDQLSPADLETFRREGFLAIDNVFTPEEVAAACDGLSHLIRGGNPAYTGVQFEESVKDRLDGMSDEQRERHVRKIMYFVNFDARLRAMCDKPIMTEIVRRLVGSDVTMIQDMALLKPAHVGREKPWHQDTAYFALEPLEWILGTWTALDAATVANGCMHVIPGTHLQGPKAHYHDRDCQLPDDLIDVEHDVCVPLAPGGVMFFSGLLHHGTPANRSPQRRRALQFHYASVFCRQTDLAGHATNFHDAGGYAGCAGWMNQQEPRPIAERR